MNIYQQLVFIDIITTGCRPAKDSLLEVGLQFSLDGKHWLYWQQRFHTENHLRMINKNTLANNLTDAIEFNKIANELAGLLQNKIIVSLQSYLKWSFLKQAFKKSGLNINTKIICLEKCQQMLAKPLTDFQQLNSSCQLTVLQKTEIYQKCFFSIIETVASNDPEEFIYQQINIAKLPTGLSKKNLKTIPNRPGVYLFFGDNNALLYIGKSLRLKERILSHFAAAQNDSKEMQLLRQTKKIEWIETIGELGALLQESQMVKLHMPLFNRRLRKHKALFAILLKKDKEEKYFTFAITTRYESEEDEKLIQTGLFRHKRKALEVLRKIIKENNLCLKLAGLDNSKTACFYHQIHKCLGACVGKEPFESYNQRTLAAFKKYFYQSWPYNGSVVIREVCNDTQREIFHLVNEWCYLGSKEKLSDINALKNINNTFSFDLDIYKILNSFFKYKLDIKNLIKISP